MKHFSIVVAIDEKNGIGKKGGLAWKLSADLKHFKEITTTTIDPQKKNAVIMGRKTWDSLPEKFKPLPGRLNVVLSQNANQMSFSGVLFFTFFDEALKYLNIKEEIENIFVIGGAQVYIHALEHPKCENLYVTHLKGDFGCDTFFSNIPNTFLRKDSLAWLFEGPIQYRFSQYQKIN